MLHMLPIGNEKGDIDEYEYPKDGLGGSLRENATKARRLHEYFLVHWEKMLPSQTGNRYVPEIIPMRQFSINYFTRASVFA